MDRPISIERVKLYIERVRERERERERETGR